MLTSMNGVLVIVQSQSSCNVVGFLSSILNMCCDSQASRILAQILMAGGTMVARAAVQAYKQAVVSEFLPGLCCECTSFSNFMVF